MDIPPLVNSFFLQREVERVEMYKRAALVFKDRLTKLSDLPGLIKPLLLGDEFRGPDIPDTNKELICLKNSSPEETADTLCVILNKCVPKITNDQFLDRGELEQLLKRFGEENQLTRASYLHPLRVALSGLKESPPPWDMLYILGRWNSEDRIMHAVQNIL